MLFPELMSHGFKLLTVGVGTLLAFTVILFFVMRWMSHMIAKYELHQPHWVPIPVPVVSNSQEQARTAAIAAAVHRYRASFH